MSGSLSSVAGFVSDAFKLSSIAPFQPEQVALGEYGFLPWVRAGLAAALEPPTGGAVRATVKVSMAVADDDGHSEPVAQTLTLRGPGDLLGLDPTQIIRRVPAPGTRDAEESFLVHIEFDRPELPWLFTPLAPQGDKLQPWLALVVCDATVARLLPGAPGMPQVLDTPLGELPSLADAWAWAHAQVVGGATANGGPSVADRLTDQHGPTNLSRLLCPRKLEPDRSYLACLVPTFDCGARAGLGIAGGTLGPAWERTAGDETTRITLPAYDTWRFSTAAAGDFEKLAKKLEGVAAPWNVGRRLIDASTPQGGLAALPDGAPGEVQVLRCALVSPAPMPADKPPEGANWDPATRDALRREVDRAGLATDEDLPRVGPRLYARFQRAQPTVGPVFGDPPAAAAAADTDWFSQLNTSPMHRVVAGLGTRVVQQDQEALMQAAWAQVGDLERANHTLIRIQFGRYVGEALHRTQLGKLAVGELSQVMRGVQGKLRKDGAAATIHGAVGASWVAPAAMSAAFRRTTRVRGPLARFADEGGRAALRQMLATGAEFRDFRRSYVEPDGVATLSEAAIAAIPREIVARKLGVSEAAAPAALATHLATRRDSASIADRVLAPLSTWHVASGTVDFGSTVAADVAARVNAAMPLHVDSEPARAEALSALLVGLANSDVPEVSAPAGEMVEQVADRLPFSAAAANPGVATHIGLPGRIAATHAASSTSTAFSGRARRRATSATVLETGAASAAPRPRIRFETPAARQLTDAVTSSKAVRAIDAARALSELALGSGALELPRTPERPALVLERATLLRAVEPARTATAYARSRLAAFPEWLAADWFDDGRVEPIMAAPHFDRPMYEALDAYNRDWLVPGLGSIAQPDFVTVLETNPAFTEAFLIGLSDEMGRELLWRGYPTDQRGTYFRRFWNPDQDELAQEIHRLSRAPLGTHLANDGGGSGHLVLVVRGELVRRYPDALMFAMRAGGTNGGKPVFSDPHADPSAVAGHLFHAHLSPDILLVGFRLTREQVRTEPWWFVIAEHPTAPRFGLDLFDAGNSRAGGASLDRDKLDWNDLTSDGSLAFGHFLSPAGRTVAIKDPRSTPTTLTWPGTAAIVARTLLQSPIRAAFDARKLIAPALT